MRADARTRPSRAAAAPSKPDETLVRVANWLRDQKKSGVTTREAVQYEKRVEYFKGAKLLDALLSAKYRACKGFPVVRNEQDAVALANLLMRVHFFHRSQRVFISARRWELEALNGPFEREGLYTWMHDGSQARLYLLCALTLAGALLLCMIQIWPIWMKIGLWWCSVTFLATFSVLCIVRLLLFVVMFAVGFRGIWLFPNLFDDNQTFAGSFMPIIGRAEPVVGADEYDSDDDELRRIRKKKSGSDSDATDGDGAKKRRPDEEPAYQFGLINAAILGVIGLIACWNLGFFDGENVPDFVAKHEDLQYYFPTIAPPENTTASMGEEGVDADEHDPFAQPAAEEEHF